MWKIFIIFISFFSSFHYAFMAAFDGKGAPVRKLNTFELFYESLFLVSIVMNLITEYNYPASQKIERKINKIILIYLRGSFAYDVVAILPLRIIFWDLENNYRKLFYLVKLIRLQNGFKYLSHRVFMNEVKKIVQSRIAQIIDKDNKLAND